MSSGHQLSDTVIFHRNAPPPPTPQIEDIRSHKHDADLRKSLLEALNKIPDELSAVLPDLVLWDEQGLKLFEDVTQCSSYYLTRDEIELLTKYRLQIAAHIKPRSMIVELGSGNLRKTKILLDALEELARPVDYYALDVSHPELQRTLGPLVRQYKHVRCSGLLGTYSDALEWLQSPPNKNRQKAILHLGSTLGNLDRKDAAKFLFDFGHIPNSSILLGLDGCKDEQRVKQAYNDPEGRNHKFIMNGLVSANRILGGDIFDLKNWVVDRDWDDRMGVHYQYYCPSGVTSLNGVRTETYNRLYAACSHKYDDDDLEHLCKDASLVRSDSWKSDNMYHLLYLTIDWVKV